MEVSIENNVPEHHFPIKLNLENETDPIRSLKVQIPKSETEDDPLPFQEILVNKEQISSALSAEETIFGFSGLKVYDEIHIFDVPIKFRGTQHIHTVRSGSSSSPPLVLIHGYGGSSVTFYKMIKDLSVKFQVFCIDLLGMGLSSRPKFEIYNTEECIAFFVDSIEEWRKALKLDQITLCGHSLGGYLSVNYALKYTSFISRLVLMSPAGIIGGDDLNFEEYVKNSSFMRRQFLKLASKIWKKKYTPNKLYQNTGFLGRYVLKLYVTKRWSSTKAEAKPLQSYFDKILSMPESSEAALHILLLPKAIALLPMEEYIRKNLSKINIVFIYGDRDWMDSSGASRLHKELPNVDFHLIRGAGHHANMDQPKEVCKIMVADIKKK